MLPELSEDCRAVLGSVCREGDHCLIKEGLNVKSDLHSGVSLLPAWDKPSQGKAQGAIALLLL